LRAEGEAIQSEAPYLDCFVASRLAMTAKARRRSDQSKGDNRQAGALHGLI
jgi:hypothetical protein